MTKTTIVLVVIGIVFLIRLVSILRRDDIPPRGKRMATSIFVFTIIALVVVYFVEK